jgi:uncharacterized protein YggE
MTVRNRRVRALALPVALGLACIGMAALAGTALAGPLPEYPFAYADGSARREIAPDVATVSFSVSAQAPGSEAAIASVQATSKKAFDLLAKAGVKPTDINAAQLTKSRTSHWDEATRNNVLDGYQVTRQVSATVHDLDRYPAMFLALMGLPGAEGFGSSFGRSDQQAIENELVVAATDDARTHAERLAAGARRKLGPVRAVSQVGFADLPARFGFGSTGGGPVPMMRLAMAAPAPPADAYLVPATITLGADVHVVFELQ